MELQEIKTLIQQELPLMFRTDPTIRQFVLDLTRDRYADKAETTDRFELLLAEIHALRDEGNQKWEKNQRELQTMREEENRKWDENNRKWEENNRQLQIMREEDNRKWEENKHEWQTMREEDNRKWDENQQAINSRLDEIAKVNRKHDSTIGALGTRWGLHTEGAFREALKGILGDSFGVTVEQVTLWDDKGEVFGQPDQIELDVIIKNGTLILCEIKAAASRGDVHIFWKKCNFYAAVHQREINRRLVISPMVDKRASNLAAKLGIEVYSYAEDVTNL